MLYVGRVAVEKNIEAFLRLDLPGTKLVVGAGPQLDQLKRRYPAAVFAGVKMGEDLASHFAASDVFVFPSVTDTFGLVLLEALASGVPVAAFPVPGPLDVVGAAPVGRLDDDLAAAIRGALTSEPAACRAHAEQYSWAACARQFLENVRPFEFDAIVARRGSRQPEAEVRVS
jgi:glycosyltransferase involved in cell wall biosynthesis